jgi:hypothetical protein
MSRTQAGVAMISIFAAATAAVIVTVRSSAGVSVGPPVVIPVAYAHVNPNRPAPVSAAVALSLAFGRMSNGAVGAAAFGSPPPGTSSDRANLPWLHERIRVTSLDAGAPIEALWEGDLLEGAVVEGFATTRNAREALGGATFDLEFPSGDLLANHDGGLGDVAVGQEFSHESGAAVKAAIQSALRRYALAPVSITVLRPLGPAPAVIASAADPRAVAEQYTRIVEALFGAPPSYEGYYIDLRDPSGASFITASASFRTGAGRCWIDPAYAQDSSLICGASRFLPG